MRGHAQDVQVAMTCPIASLTHSHDLAGVGEGLFDSPPCGITGYQIFCGRFEIGGDQRKP